MTSTLQIDTKNSKIVLITGATSGIGNATAKGIIMNASYLILPVRNIEKGNNLKSELLKLNPNCHIEILPCDLESIESVKNCAFSISKKYPVIDVLINNAGIMEPDFRLTEDAIEAHFQVNVLSQYIFNTILQQQILASSQGRIINMSSGLHSQGKFQLDTLNYKPTGNLAGVGLYSNSNLYRNLLTFELAQKLQNSKVTVNCLHPGVINTNLGTGSSNRLWNFITPIFHLFTKPSTDGAKTSIHLALSDEGGNISGKYWSDSKVATPGQLSTDLILAKQLSSKCKELTKI